MRPLPSRHLECTHRGRLRLPANPATPASPTSDIRSRREPDRDRQRKVSMLRPSRVSTSALARTVWGGWTWWRTARGDKSLRFTKAGARSPDHGSHGVGDVNGRAELAAPTWHRPALVELVYDGSGTHHSSGRGHLHRQAQQPVSGEIRMIFPPEGHRTGRPRHQSV